jgi:acetyl-CoA synthetase
MSTVDHPDRLSRRLLRAAELPTTRSGKIMRRLLRDLADGRELGHVTTLGGPSVVAALKRQVAGRRAGEP